jgi:hypothetical protein
MKIILCDSAGSFSIEGEDFKSIARMLKLPPWAVDSHSAWARNCWGDDLTLHVEEGLIVMVEASPRPVPEVNKPGEERFGELWRKVQTYSDYHKDFYGYRPTGDSLSPLETVVAFDAIAAEHEAMMKTREGRVILRANGWEVPAAPPAPKAKKVAHQKP